MHPSNIYTLIKRGRRNLCILVPNNGLQFNYNKWMLLNCGQNDPLFTYTLGSHAARCNLSQILVSGALQTYLIKLNETITFPRTNHLSEYKPLICTHSRSFLPSSKFLSRLFFCLYTPFAWLRNSIMSSK